jgi:hypothetical protein
MGGELLFDEPGSAVPQAASPPAWALLAALLTTLTCGALCAVAIVGHAPDVVVPLVVTICIGGPVLASWQVPSAVATLRARRRGARALAQLRRGLADLPDTEHPLGVDG